MPGGYPLALRRDPREGLGDVSRRDRRRFRLPDREGGRTGSLAGWTGAPCFFPWRRGFWRPCFRSGLLLALAAAGVFWFRWQCWGVQTTHTVAELSGLPAGFDGYRIAHLSDLHGHEYGEDSRELVERVREGSPDVVAVGQQEGEHAGLVRLDGRGQLLRGGLVGVAVGVVHPGQRDPRPVPLQDLVWTAGSCWTG